MRLFRDRMHAGRELGEHLAYLRSENPIVVGIPNGGLPVAAVVAEALAAPLDILLVSKLESPAPPKHIVGAVDEHGRISMIQTAARWHHLSSQQMIGPAREAFVSLQDRRVRYRAILPEIDVRGRVVVIVNQGVTTGATLLAAISSLRDRGAAKVIAAAPAGCGKATWQIRDAAHAVVIPHTPPLFKGVDHFYDDFSEVTDDIVIAMLHKWAARRSASSPSVKTVPLRVINKAERVIHCELDLPPEAQRGSGPYPAVIFAHGLESDARSPRSVPISRRLAKRGVIGVRMDFTGHGHSEGAPEDSTEQQMLDDLRTVYENICVLNEVDSAHLGLNGSGTGGMIALQFAADHPELRALVVRGPVSGGEIEAARRVTTPTLIIHAEYDTALRPTVDALDHELAATHKLLTIPDSSRMFSDPISLELMVGASVDWLMDHLMLPIHAPASEQTDSQPAEPSGQSVSHESGS